MSKNKDYIKLINCHRWRKLRNEQLKRNPLCNVCGDIATEVHHLRPIESEKEFDRMETLAYDPNNLQSLCHKCHSATHIAMKKHKKQTNQIINRNKLNDFFNRYFN
ncbi:HNH endonuclease [Bacteroides congonensis]|uniref:HNH endonuclease n=1 Tax=Bacteroides congonensis TaxID=1871006 RepID=UPI000934804A|nr:HNH endonuclease [Bacteroides congonensis]